MRLRHSPVAAALLALVLALLVLLLLAPPAGKSGAPRARVVGETQVARNVADLKVESTALGRTATVRLITPRGWEARKEGRALAGAVPAARLLRRARELGREHRRRRAVRAARRAGGHAEAGAVGFYSDWWNHGAGGPPAWETFHLRELRRLLQRDYGAGRRRPGRRSLDGRLRRPVVRRPPSADVPRRRVVQRVRAPALQPQALLSLLGGFAPDASALWGDPDAQRSIWNAHDPFTLARRLRRIPLFLSVGDGTAGPFDAPGARDAIEGFLHDMNVAFAGRLRRLGIEATTDFYGPGTHRWPYWERELRRSLPLLLRALRPAYDD